MEETVDTTIEETPENGTGSLLSVTDFAAKIKTKYPQYKDVPDSELTQRIVDKYPEYKATVRLSQPEIPTETLNPQEAESGLVDTDTKQVSPISTQEDLQATTGRKKLIENLAPKVQQIMNNGVMGNTDYFKDPKNRERFFNNLSDRYSPDEISQLKGEDVALGHKIGQLTENLKPKADAYMQSDFAGTDEGDNAVTRIISSPEKAFTEGILGGWKQLQNTGNVYDTEGEISAAGNAAASVTKMIFGALNVLPAMAGFTAGTTAASEVAPETVHKILAPVSAITKPQTEGGKAWAEVGDFLVFAGVVGGAAKGKAMVEGKINQSGIADPDVIAKGLQKFSELPKEEQKAKIEDYANTIVKENKIKPNLTPAEKKVYTFSKQADDLMAEIANAPEEVKPLYAAKLQEVDAEHSKAADEATTQHIEQAANKTVVDDLVEQKTNLENHEPVSETGKKIKEEQLTNINNLISKLQENGKEKISNEAQEGQELLNENGINNLASQEGGETKPPPVSEKETEDYKGEHILAEHKTTADKLSEGGTGFEWENAAQDHDLTDKATKESYRVLKSIKGNPDAEVTIYRSVPKGVDKINEGDWITLSKIYAKEHGMHETDATRDMPVISMKVKAKDIVWDGNDLNEFAYKPKAEQPTVSEKTPEEKAGIEEANSLSKEHGYESATHLLNSVKANIGKEFKTVQEALKDDDVNAFLTEREFNNKDFTEEEIQNAYNEREQELKKVPDFKEQLIHDNLGRIRRSDFEHYADKKMLDKSNISRMNILHFSDKAEPLDTKMQELSNVLGIELTPQDAVDYILDRERNPEKYLKQKVSTFKAAKEIPLDKAKVIAENPDLLTEKDVEDLRGFPLTDEESDILIENIKNKENERLKTSDSGTGESVSKPEKISSAGKKSPIEKVRQQSKELEKNIKSKKQKENATTKSQEQKQESNQQTGVSEHQGVSASRNEAEKQGADNSNRGTNSEGAKQEKTLTKSEKSKARLDAARKALSDKLRGSTQSGGLNALPEFVEYVKAFIEYVGNKVEDFIRDWRELNPESKHTDKEIEDAFNEVKAQREKGLTHAETEAEREAKGLGERQKREKKTDIQLEAEADAKIKEGYDVEKLADDILKEKSAPSDVEHVILTKYASLLDKKLNEIDPNSPEFDKTLETIDKVYRASESGGSEAGAALGIRGRFKTIGDETLSDYFIKEKQINKDAPLTESQKSKVVEEFNKIKEAKEALEKKLAETEKENARLKAQKELNKIISRRFARKVSVEKLDTEFEDLSKEFSKIARGTLSAGINPELAGIIGKMVKNRVEKGVIKLADLIDAIHEKVAEHGIKKDDIRNVIAGDYTEKKQTRNEATKNLYELRQEAKLIKQYEDLQKGIEPSSERKKIQRNQQLEALRKQIKEHDLSKLADYKKRLQSQTEKIQEQLKKNDFAKPEPKKPVVLDAEAKRLKDAYIKARQEREVRIMKQEYENRNRYERTRDKIIEVLNVPRTIMSSMDFSAPLRQALIATISHPKMAAEAGLEMFKQSVSQKRFDRWFYDVKDDPRYTMSKEAGLYIADPHDPRLTAKEEAFMNNLAEKIPVIGKAIKGSERAYVGYLNKMRWDLFNRFADEYEAQGKTFDNNPVLYKELAHYVNNVTGRGKLGAAESAAPILNSFLFAPRLIASRINMLSNWANPKFYAKVPKEIRVQYFKDMAKFIGLGLTVLSLAKLNGAEVEDDPRSSDFGKIKSGNTRWDIWGGHQQYIRVLTQLLTGESKSANKGIIQDLSGKGAFGRTRGDVLLSFIRGKLAPIPSIGADILAGRTISGEKPTIATEAENHLLPLLANDIESAVKDQGVKALFTVGVPSTFGVGVQTYLPKQTTGGTSSGTQSGIGSSEPIGSSTGIGSSQPIK